MKTILKDPLNCQVIIIWMLVLAILPLNQATLVIEKIDSELGFAEVKVDEVEIVNKFDIVLHIIHPREILDIILELENKIHDFNFTNEISLTQQLFSMKNQVMTLFPQRNKRGLVNIVGKGLKWFFGTLDEADRIEIEELLKVREENNHNTTKAIYQQVEINENFNNSFIGQEYNYSRVGQEYNYERA